MNKHPILILNFVEFFMPHPQSHRSVRESHASTRKEPASKTSGGVRGGLAFLFIAALVVVLLNNVNKVKRKTQSSLNYPYSLSSSALSASKSSSSISADQYVDPRERSMQLRETLGRSLNRNRLEARYQNLRLSQIDNIRGNGDHSSSGSLSLSGVAAASNGDMLQGVPLEGEVHPYLQLNNESLANQQASSGMDISPNLDAEIQQRLLERRFQMENVDPKRYAEARMEQERYLSELIHNAQELGYEVQLSPDLENIELTPTARTLQLEKQNLGRAPQSVTDNIQDANQDANLELHAKNWPAASSSSSSSSSSAAYSPIQQKYRIAPRCLGDFR